MSNYQTTIMCLKHSISSHVPIQGALNVNYFDLIEVKFSQSATHVVYKHTHMIVGCVKARCHRQCDDTQQTLISQRWQFSEFTTVLCKYANV